MFAGFTGGVLPRGIEWHSRQLPRCVHVPDQTWKVAQQGPCLSAQRAPQLLGSGDLVEVTEERCIDKLDITDRTAGHLHPYLANLSGPRAAGGCWLRQVPSHWL